MRKLFLVVLSVIIMLVLTSCGTANLDQDKSAEINYGDSVGLYANSERESDDTASFEEKENTQETTSNEITQDRMIIHTAQMYIKVKSLADSQSKLEEKIDKYGGYLVESNINQTDDTDASGNMTVRIPAKHFKAFLADTDDIAAEVVEKNISGQDVTEEYVDLSSRLTSKRVVEKRLIAFMEEAEKTSDLLTISADLAEVQEEIEVIIGKMNYLDNQADFSTVHIHMSEANVTVPEIDSSKLNTWENTKKQFMTSVNTILTAGSSLVVFFIGNIPMIALILLALVIVYIFVRRKRKSEM